MEEEHCLFFIFLSSLSAFPGIWTPFNLLRWMWADRHWPSSNPPLNSDAVTYVKQAMAGSEHLQTPLRDSNVMEREGFYRERYFYTGRKWVFLIRSRWGLWRHCAQICIVSFVVLVSEGLNTCDWAVSLHFICKQVALVSLFAHLSIFGIAGHLRKNTYPSSGPPGN